MRAAFAALVASLAFASIVAAGDLDDAGCRGKFDDYYHPKAVRLHEWGTVLVEFSVNTKGVPERIVVVESTASDALRESAILVVTKMRCKPTKEWIDSGGLEGRLRLNVMFQFSNEEAAKPIDPEVEQVVITADRDTRR